MLKAKSDLVAHVWELSQTWAGLGGKDFPFREGPLEGFNARRMRSQASRFERWEAPHGVTGGEMVTKIWPA
jgi:hypothetical protein